MIQSEHLLYLPMSEPSENLSMKSTDSLRFTGPFGSVSIMSRQRGLIQFKYVHGSIDFLFGWRADSNPQDIPSVRFKLLNSFRFLVKKFREKNPVFKNQFYRVCISVRRWLCTYSFPALSTVWVPGKRYANIQ